MLTEEKARKILTWFEVVINKCKRNEETKKSSLCNTWRNYWFSQELFIDAKPSIKWLKGNGHFYDTKLKPYALQVGHKKGKNIIINGRPIIKYVSPDIMQFEDHLLHILAKKRVTIGVFEKISEVLKLEP